MYELNYKETQLTLNFSGLEKLFVKFKHLTFKKKLTIKMTKPVFFLNSQMYLAKFYLQRNFDVIIKFLKCWKLKRNS